MKPIAIYGAGGLGREVCAMLGRLRACDKDRWEFIGFFDDGKSIGEEIGHWGKVLGGINDVNSWKEPLDLVLAFGSPNTLAAIHSKINNPVISFPNIIEKTSFFADPKTFSIGEGNIIGGVCCFSVNTSIGSFNLFNGFTSCGHDFTMGNYNVIMPGARISGDVKMGDSNLMGSDSFVLQGLKIGNHVTLSPLSALLTKPKNGNTYIGNPAKLFRY